jgi:hypothetical protein
MFVSITRIDLVFAMSCFISHPFLTPGKLIGKKDAEPRIGGYSGGSTL